MIRSRFVRSLVLAVFASVTLACGDNSLTAPSTNARPALVAPDSAQNSLLGGLVGGLIGVVVSVVKTVILVVEFVADASDIPIRSVAWSSSHRQVSYTVSKTITSDGGSLSIPQADFVIAFPRGAVSQPTTITITADPKFVAYKMSPHGIRFAKPVVVTQGLEETTVAGKPLSGRLFGAYITDETSDLSKLKRALEIEQSLTILVPGSTNQPNITTWTLNHFSRYMLASD